MEDSSSRCVRKNGVSYLFTNTMTILSCFFLGQIAFLFYCRGVFLYFLIIDFLSLLNLCFFIVFYFSLDVLALSLVLPSTTSTRPLLFLCFFLRFLLLLFVLFQVSLLFLLFRCYSSSFSYVMFILINSLLHGLKLILCKIRILRNLYVDKN